MNKLTIEGLLEPSSDESFTTEVKNYRESDKEIKDIFTGIAFGIYDLVKIGMPPKTEAANQLFKKMLIQVFSSDQQAVNLFDLIEKLSFEKSIELLSPILRRMIVEYLLEKYDRDSDVQACYLKILKDDYQQPKNTIAITMFSNLDEISKSIRTAESEINLLDWWSKQGKTLYFNLMRDKVIEILPWQFEKIQEAVLALFEINLDLNSYHNINESSNSIILIDKLVNWKHVWVRGKLDTHLALNTAEEIRDAAFKELKCDRPLQALRLFEEALKKNVDIEIDLEKVNFNDYCFFSSVIRPPITDEDTRLYWSLNFHWIEYWSKRFDDSICVLAYSRDKAEVLTTELCFAPFKGDILEIASFFDCVHMEEYLMQKSKISESSMKYV